VTKKFSYTSIDLEYLRLYKSANKFIKENTNIIFTKADKGNITVAMDRNGYIFEMNKTLSDEDTYVKVEKNPVRKIESSLTDTLKRWFKKEYITKQQLYHLRTSDALLPKAYGLPKMHKEGYPLRVIVSSVNSPLYSIAKYIHKVLNNSLPLARSFIKSSFDLYDRLVNKKIDDNNILISLDVVSLFTNVPVELAITAVNNRWSYIEKNTNIPKDEFVNMVNFILTSTYFSFEGEFYKQIFGTPMGSPLSPILADLVLQDIENKALYKIGKKLPLYVRYVDDILLIAPKEDCDNIIKIFNSFHDRIQFTFEKEVNRTLNYLELSISVDNNNQLIIDWFHKNTFSGRYLSFHSNHPLCHKIGTIYSLIDRAILLSNPIFHRKNIIFCIDNLIENGFPLPLIFKYIKSRIKNLITAKQNNNVNSRGTIDSNSNNNNTFICVPYIKGLSEHVGSALRTANISAGYKCFNRLNKFIKTHKDITPTLNNNNVIYRINCKDCDASYVGQTKRQLNTRIKEHKANIKQHQSKLTVISQHILNSGHQMDWENVQILDHESNYSKRIISETIFIKLQKNGLNVVEDTESLDEMYFPLLESLTE
jgi:hypothetical protein